MMMPELEQQLAYFDRHAEKAFARCLRDLRECRSDVLRAARTRLEEGYEEYHDEGFHWPYERLREAEMEEYADAVNYRLMRMFQGWPT